MDRLKIFLNNGFKFEGKKLDDAPEGFIGIHDSKDNRKRYFPLTSIQNIEVVE